MTDTNETGLAVLGGAELMQESLKQNQNRMLVVHEFIDRIFEENTDYGPSDPRSKKKTLLKPGAEKVCKHFSCTPQWRMDEDTWKMLGSPSGTVCYICEIVDSTGKIIGTGRGAETVGNKQRDMNKTIKNAEKCALVDAALYTFALSERFTQDDGGLAKKTLDSEKAELIAMVELARVGIDTEMTTLQFLHHLEKTFLNSRADTIGKVQYLKKAILEDELFDLSNGDTVK